MNDRGYFPDWDIDAEDGRRAEEFVENIREGLKAGRIEVKFDRKASETSNVYIEYECRYQDGAWHQTGIQTTKATHWAFVFKGHRALVLVEVDLLREAVRANWPRGGRECSTGSHPTRGVVVPLADLIQRGLDDVVEEAA